MRCSNTTVCISSSLKPLEPKSLGVLLRIRNKLRRVLAIRAARRSAFLDHGFPVVSFSFDDFPTSALEIGGAILNRSNVYGTYYASFSLMDHDSPVGRIFSASDIEKCVASGHELGCHTFSHCCSWDIPRRAFEASLLENASALARLRPGSQFETLAYPYGNPSPWAKKACARYFSCGRGGGQALNAGSTDLNNLRAFFLEQSRDQPERIVRLIALNQMLKGWLIFGTHDVTECPSPFGCRPHLLEEVVRASIESGARVLPIGQAWRLIRSCLGGQPWSEAIRPCHGV